MTNIDFAKNAAGDYIASAEGFEFAVRRDLAGKWHSTHRADGQVHVEYGDTRRDAARSMLAHLKRTAAQRQEATPAEPASRTAWEGDVIDIVAETLEVTHSDATGIVDAQAFRMAQAWARGDDAKAAAESVIAEGEPAADDLADVSEKEPEQHLASRLEGLGADELREVIATLEGDADELGRAMLANTLSDAEHREAPERLAVIGMELEAARDAYAALDTGTAIEERAADLIALGLCASRLRQHTADEIDLALCAVQESGNDTDAVATLGDTGAAILYAESALGW